MVEVVREVHLDESPGMGKYPEGHVAAGFIYLELRFVF
jgi:hypothetical protein